MTEPEGGYCAAARVRQSLITPGDYVLQVIVTDKLAKEKHRGATQAMDFEIPAALPPQP